MKNGNTILFGIRVDELENYLETNLTALRKTILQTTDTAVVQGLRDTTFIKDEILAAIEVFKSHAGKILNPEIEKIAQEIILANLEAQQQLAAFDERVINQKITNLDVDIKRIKITYNWSYYYKTWFAIFALSSIDSLMNYSSYQVLAKYLIAAIGISLGTAFCLGMSAHTIGKRMQRATTMKQKWIWFLSGLLGGGIVFYGLGILRQAYVRDTGQIANSPIIWMLLNNFFFTIAIVLAYTKLPNLEQLHEKNSKDQNYIELKKLKAEKEILLAKLKKEENRINDCKQRLESFKIYRNELLTTLENEKDFLIAMYLKELAIKTGTRSPLNHLLT